MLVDSHCHLNFKELNINLDDYLQQMQENQVNYALCIGTTPDNLADVVGIADKHKNIFATVGIHPDEKLDNFTLTKEFLEQYLTNPKVVGIGETGLDYYLKEYTTDFSWQHDRFRLHIEVAKKAHLPLIIHTRNSCGDTLGILKEYGISDNGSGVVMHCFTESIDNAKKCIDLGFYISISGIVTFQNAITVKEMAKYVPQDRLLVETDSPFLAPTPFRGKINHPALVKYTAEYLANLRGTSLDHLAEVTTNNFFNLFKKASLLIT